MATRYARQPSPGFPRGRLQRRITAGAGGRAGAPPPPPGAGGGRRRGVLRGWVGGAPPRRAGWGGGRGGGVRGAAGTAGAGGGRVGVLGRCDGARLAGHDTVGGRQLCRERSRGVRGEGGLGGRASLADGGEGRTICEEESDAKWPKTGNQFLGFGGETPAGRAFIAQLNELHTRPGQLLGQSYCRHLDNARINDGV